MFRLTGGRKGVGGGGLQILRFCQFKKFPHLGAWSHNSQAGPWSEWISIPPPHAYRHVWCLFNHTSPLAFSERPKTKGHQKKKRPKKKMLRSKTRISCRDPSATMGKLFFFFFWGGCLLLNIPHRMYVKYVPFGIAESRLDFSLHSRYSSSTPRNFLVHLEGTLCNHIYMRIGLTPTPFMSVLEIMPTCRRTETPVSLLKRRRKNKKSCHIFTPRVLHIFLGRQ
jgi:hypothetical protein